MTDYPWKLWKFGNLPKNYWKTNPVKAREFLDDIAKELDIKTFEDWYLVSKSIVKSKGIRSKINDITGGTALIGLHNDSLEETLRKVYPGLQMNAVANVKNLLGVLKVFEMQKVRDFGKTNLFKENLWKRLLTSLE